MAVFPERLLLHVALMPPDKPRALRGALFLPPLGGLLETATGWSGREAINDGTRTTTASSSSSSSSASFQGSMLDSLGLLLGGGASNMWIHDWTVSLGGGMYISPNRGATSCWVWLLLPSPLLFRHNKVTRSMMRYRKELHSVL